MAKSYIFPGRRANRVPLQEAAPLIMLSTPKPQTLLLPRSPHWGKHGDPSIKGTKGTK